MPPPPMGAEPLKSFNPTPPYADPLARIQLIPEQNMGVQVVSSRFQMVQFG